MELALQPYALRGGRLLLALSTGKWSKVGLSAATLLLPNSCTTHKTIQAGQAGRSAEWMK